MNLTAFSFLAFLAITPLLFSESDGISCNIHDSLVITTDKFHYSPGDTIIVSGCLSKDIINEDLRLSLDGVEKILLSTIVKPNSDGTFTYEITTENFSGNEPYWIKAEAGFQVAEAQIVFSRFGQLCGSISDENPILIFTDKENYQRGDKISVFGCLANIAFTKGINIVIYDEDGKLVASDTFSPDVDRTFSSEFKINDSFIVDGKYTVEVDAAGLYQTNKTIVVPEFGPLIMGTLALGFFLVALMTRPWCKTYGS